MSCVGKNKKILVLHDTFSSFTVSSIIADEQHQTMHSVLISSVSLLRPNPQTKVTIRVDNAPGLFALRNDFVLEQSLIELDFGRVHNKKKNLVVDKGIRELNSEILCLLLEGGPIPPSTLALATSQLYARIRNRGLSAWEILFQCDQYTGDQLDISDLSLAESQVTHRLNNQRHSAKHKSRSDPSAQKAEISVGSLVYIKEDGNKTKSRDRYIVTDIDKDHCKVQKFTKSHLRLRKYDLKLTEIYPVSSDVTLSDPVAFQKDDSSDESEERDSELLTHACYQDLDSEQAQSVEIDHHNYPQPSITLSSTQTSSLHDVDPPGVDPIVSHDSVEPDVDTDINQNHNVHHKQEQEPYRSRSSCQSHTPGWMTSGDYIFEEKAKK